MRILKRDPCGLCGALPGEVQAVDHIVPRSRGGASNWENYSALCRACNSAKNNLSLLEVMRRRMVARELVPLLREYWGGTPSAHLAVPRGLTLS